ncbi:MAG: NERD domain-containing protein [Brooklawnia sp.]|nr:NERD domain-containing protein [Brooklawnia sp.]
MPAVEQEPESVPPARTARRGYLAEDDDAHHLQVAPKRALITDMVVPGSAFGEIPVIRENPRRRAPMRALLDRLLIGLDGGARRALVDPDALLAAELIRLAGLDPRWGFLQSARLVDGGSELDHWVIGPGGIYLLNAKHLPGSRLRVVGDRFTVDGQEQPYVSEIRGEARRSADRFSMTARWDVSVTGVIVPVNDRRLVIEHFPDGVAVVDQLDVANWLVNRPEQLSKRQILAAFGAARESTIWKPKFEA